MANEYARRAPETAPDSAHGLDFVPRGKVFDSPRDWRDLVVYQFLFDRFDDNKDTPLYKPGDPLPPRKQDGNAQGSVWQGGTFKGATRRLDYLHKLGARAVWVSPPLKTRQSNPHAYHGYGIQDFLDVDPHLGTIQDFVDFVSAAHERGMWVIMDVIIDHTADVFRYADPNAVWTEDEHGNPKRWEIGGWHDDSRGGDESKPLSRNDAIWPKELQNPEAFKRFGPMRDVGAARGAEAKDGDFMSLKVLNLQHGPTLDAIIGCYKYWMAVADVDGFRIDALRHVRHPVASDFVHAIREYAQSIGKHNFLQVGEVADSDEEMRRYVGTNVELVGPERDPDTDPDNTGDYPYLDAVIDFELHRRIIPVLLGEQPATSLGELNEKRRRYYRYFGDAARYYLSYLENHDQGGRDRHRLLFGTVDQTPPDYNRPGGDPRLAVMSYAVLMCMMGIPCLYYGTEQGFDGGGDSDIYVRESMFGSEWGPFASGGGCSWFDESHPIYQQIARITDARRAEPALRYGRQYLRPLSGDGIHFGPPEHAGVFAIARVLASTEIICVANPTLEDIEVCVGLDGILNPKGSMLRNLLDGSWRTTVEATHEGQAFARLHLPARTAAILRQSID